uniref:Uncharacterized protein n=1 Tax=Oryza rufipogon TaxID=4529 RepID=A0A0E0Q8Q2_ORYRU
MTIDEKREFKAAFREFKAAFVLYVTTKLLAPQSCANFISPRYIRAVADADNIKQYNWSQFVIDEVKKAAKSLPKRFPNTTQQSINGCIIFLMAKYFSKLVIRKVGITSVKSCHISQFEDNQIAMMIQQDIVSKHNPGYTFPRYGKLQLMKAPRENYPQAPEREFKAAFVLYVTTKLLAPQSCANFISPRYIRAVADVDNIKQYNWSQFVVDEVKKAAESLPKRFPNTTQQSINGCIIFLMFEDNQIAMMIQQDIVSKHNPGYPFPRYGKLQAPRENYPQAPEVSPLNLSSVSKIQCRGNDGGANLIKFLESHFNSLDVSAMVGPQAYKELKSYVQDGFNQIDEILPSIADFVDISNLKTATEAANMFKKAFKYNMAAAVKIATRAAVRNVIDTIEDMQGPLHP